MEYTLIIWNILDLNHIGYLSLIHLHIFFLMLSKKEGVGILFSNAHSTRVFTHYNDNRLSTGTVALQVQGMEKIMATN